MSDRENRCCACAEPSLCQSVSYSVEIMVPTTFLGRDVGQLVLCWDS